MIPWWDVTEAAAAAAELFDVRCAATCRGLHSLVFTDRLGIHVRKIVGHTPPPPVDLAAELHRCGYRRVNGSPIEPQRWPHPGILNPPLQPRSYTCPTTSTTD